MKPSIMGGLAAAAISLSFMVGCEKRDCSYLPPVPAEAETAFASIEETINPRDVELLRFVSEGYPTMEGEVANTSWGSVVRVVVGDDFISAAGSLCRRAVIVADDGRIDIVLKKKAEGAWEIVKSIV